MRNDLTDLTLIIDRSGSMTSCKTDAEGGINAFIEAQRKEPGECLFSLIQFDTKYEFVHNGIPIKDVTPYQLHPRGWTALLDAVGRAIDETGNRLQAMPEDQRPGLVAFVIVTDGEENSSRIFIKEQIKQKIEHQQSVYSWKFTFLGANQDAFTEARLLGINETCTAGYCTRNTSKAFLGAASNVSRMRHETRTCQNVVCTYTEAERQAMK